MPTTPKAAAPAVAVNQAGTEITVTNNWPESLPKAGGAIHVRYKLGGTNQWTPVDASPNQGRQNESPFVSSMAVPGYEGGALVRGATYDLQMRYGQWGSGYSGWGGWSDVFTADVPGYAAPTGLAVAWSGAALQLTWTDPGDAAIAGWDYRLDGGGWVAIAGSGADTVSAEVAIADGAAHAVEVRYRKAGGSSEPSAEVASGAPPRAAPAPAAAVAPRDAGERWTRSVRALAPGRSLVRAVQIAHPLADMVYLVNDTELWLIAGIEHRPLRLEGGLHDDVGGSPPAGSIELDNTGHALTGWVDLVQGSAGGSVRLLEVSAPAGAPPLAGTVEWEITLPIRSAASTRRRLSLEIGPPSLRGRAAVLARYDPAHAPGLF